MDPLTLALIGGGVGLLKSSGDKQQRAADEKRNAIQKAYSTYADYTPGHVQEYNPWGDIAQFGMAGAGLGQSMEQADADKKLKAAQTGWYNSPKSAMGNNVNVVTVPNKMGAQKGQFYSEQDVNNPDASPYSKLKYRSNNYGDIGD